MTAKLEKIDAFLDPFVSHKLWTAGLICGALALNSAGGNYADVDAYLKQGLFTARTPQEQDISQRLSALGKTVTISCRPLYQMADNKKGEDTATFGYVMLVGVYIGTHRFFERELPYITLEQIDCDIISEAFDGTFSKDNSTAIALGRLTHEYQHIVTPGTSEAVTECYNAQQLSARLTKLNFDATNAARFSKQYAASSRLSNYLTPDCVPGGALDLHVNGDFPDNSAPHSA